MQENKKHSLIINDRSELTADGVRKIKFFSAETVAAETECGVLVIKGSELFVESLDSENGRLYVKGNINSAAYSGDGKEKSFFARIFK